MTLRRTLLTAHLIIGAILAPVLVLMGITGGILALQPEIEDAANTLITHVEPAGTALPLHDLTARLASRYPGARLVAAQFPGRPDRALTLTFHRPDSADAVIAVNPYTAEVLGADEDIWTLRPVHDFHTRLEIDGFGSEITGWAAVGLLFLSVSGLILWWPGKIVTIVRTGNSRRILFHLHSALAAYSWIALMLFGLTGVVLHWQRGTYDLLANATHAAPVADGSGLPASSCTAETAPDFDDLLRAAANAQPGATATWIQAGRSPGDAVRVVMRYPGDRTPAGRTLVFLDPCNGAVLADVSTRTAPFAYRLVRQWNREIHTGDLWGWPTRILAFLFSLTLPVVAVSGPLLWWSRRKS